MRPVRTKSVRTSLLERLLVSVTRTFSTWQKIRSATGADPLRTSSKPNAGTSLNRFGRGSEL